MSNFKIISFTIFLSMLLVISFTIYKVQENHNKIVLLVSEKKIEESAAECFYEDKCTGSIVTLGELIQLGYAKEEVNPVTKMYYEVLS